MAYQRVRTPVPRSTPPQAGASFAVRPFQPAVTPAGEPALGEGSRAESRPSFDFIKVPVHSPVPPPPPRGGANQAGLPVRLKAGLEQLSGQDLSDVRIHYGSPHPARVQALAYTQGNEIHLGPGQERHLPHEAWHAVQQKRQRVEPSLRLGGRSINADPVLEREADRIAARFRGRPDMGLPGRDRSPTSPALPALPAPSSRPGPLPIQRTITFATQKTFSGLDHLKSSLREQFAAKHHERINQMVDATESSGGRAISAVYVYNQILKTAATEGWTRVVQTRATGTRGPQLPQKVLTTDPTMNPESVMSTFLFPTVTVAQADLTLPDGSVVQFQARSTKETGHAEAGLMAQLDAYFAKAKVKPENCQLKITLNNAPCGSDEKDCSGKLAKYQKKMGFARLHVYFARSYGEDMESSVGTMRNAGILVTYFNPSRLAVTSTFSSETRTKMQAFKSVRPDVELDPESDEETPTVTKGSGFRPKPAPRKGRALEDGSRGRSQSRSPDRRKDRDRSRSRSRSRSRDRDRRDRDRDRSSQKRPSQSSSSSSDRLIDDPRARRDLIEDGDVRRIQGKWFRVEHAKDNGDCMYLSVAQLLGRADDGPAMRGHARAWLAAQQDSPAIAAAIARIDGNQYGQQTELQALAAHFQVRFVVYAYGIEWGRRPQVFRVGNGTTYYLIQSLAHIRPLTEL